MPTEQYFFSYQAIVEDMIKRQGLHEGRWILTLEVGLKGTNVNAQKGETPPVLSPAGILIVSQIGITKTDQVNNLTVDAAEVNPPPARKSTKRPRKKGAK